MRIKHISKLKFDSKVAKWPFPRVVWLTYKVPISFVKICTSRWNHMTFFFSCTFSPAKRSHNDKIRLMDFSYLMQQTFFISFWNYFEPQQFPQMWLFEETDNEIAGRNFVVYNLKTVAFVKMSTTFRFESNKW